MTDTVGLAQSQVEPAPGSRVTLFGYLHQLLMQGKPAATDMALQKIAELFDASAAGLTSLPNSAPPLRYQGVFRAADTIPARFPWEQNASILQRVRGEVRATGQETENGSWLISQVWEPRFGDPLLLWLWRPGPRPWATDDAAALPLAGQTIARLTFQGELPPDDQARAWQLACTRRHLDQAAVVTSRLSHDFGNVLTGIMGFTELSLTQLGASSPAGRHLQEVLEGAKAGAHWIHKLHQFCRRNVPEHWPTPLQALVPEQQSRLRESGAAGRELKTEVPADLPLLAVDADSLRHVLTQLVDNAWEAVKTAGTIVIAARPVELSESACRDMLGSPRAGRHVELSVRDTGPGLSTAARAKLFTEVFYSTKPRYRGLGLLMVFGILQRFGGGLRIDPPAPEEGTTVRVYLPVAQLPATNAAELRGARVLVVMDDPVMRQSVGMLLASAGCQVTPATGAHEALALYQTSRASFALVLTEIRLAHLGGFDLARRIQDRDPAANFLFVQMHAFPSPSRDERLKQFDVLCRPFDPPALLDSVRTALARQRPTSETSTS